MIASHFTHTRDVVPVLRELDLPARVAATRPRTPVAAKPVDIPEDLGGRPRGKLRASRGGEVSS